MQTVSIAGGISNGSCSDALTLLLVIDSFIQKAGLPSIEWPYWALHFPPFKTKRVNKSSLILLFPFVTVSVELPCMPPSGLIIYEWLYSSSVSMNQTMLSVPWRFRTNTCTVTPLLWMCLGVSGTKILAADHLSPTGCEVEHLCIGFVGPAHPIDAQSDWNLGNLETMKQTPWTLSCSSDNFWNIFAVFCPNERGHCYQRTPLCHEGGVCGLQQSLDRWYMSKIHMPVPKVSQQNIDHAAISSSSQWCTCTHHSPDLKNMINQTRQPSSVAPCSSSDGWMAI